MIQVYCENITPRHRYIFEYFIEDVVGVKCLLTDDPVEFSGNNGPKFSYGNETSKRWIAPYGASPALGNRNQGTIN